MRGLLAVLLVLLASPVAAQDWPRVYRAFLPRLVLVLSHGPTPDTTIACTGFFLNRYHSDIVTARHCLRYGLQTVNGRPGAVILEREDLDIAVIRGDGLKFYGSLPDVRRDMPTPGEALMAIGHAMGVRVPWALTGTLVIGGQAYPDEGHWNLVNRPFVGGMSGGPVVDAKGRVVGIVQQSDHTFGYLRVMDELWPVLKDYWD